MDPETGEAISSVAIGEMTHCVELQNGYYSASNDFGLAFKETEVHQSAAAPLSLPAILPQTGAEVK